MRPRGKTLLQKLAALPARQKTLLGLAGASSLFYLGLRLNSLGSLYCHTDDCSFIRDMLVVRGDLIPSLKRLFSLWTYAPAKFLVIAPLIRWFSGSAESAIWIARGSSVLIGWLGFLALGRTLWRHGGRKFTAPLVLTLFLAAFSVKEQANAQQGFNYSISPFIMLATVWGLERLLRNKRNLPPGDGLVFGLWMGALTWTQYQTTVVFAAAGLTLLLRYRKNAIEGLIAAGLGYLLLFFPLYDYSLSAVQSRGVPSWAESYALAVHDPVGIVRFYLGNLWLLLASTVMIAPDYLLGYTFLTAVALGLLVLGARKLWRTPRGSPERGILLFTAVVFGAWMAAAAVGKMPLSPTRHTLILAPLLLIGIFHGLLVCESSRHWTRLEAPARNGAFAAILLLLSALGVYGSTGYVRDRLDLIWQNLPGIVDQAKPDAIITYDWTETPHLLYARYAAGEAPVRTRVLADLDSRFEPNANELLATKPKRILFVSHRGPLVGGFIWRLGQLGYSEPRAWAQISSPASHEPLGNINGRNGFHAYSVDLR